MRRQDLIDGTLVDACEALQRSRRHRPAWLQAGWPVRFVLSGHRGRLLDTIVNDLELRTHLRRRLGKAADPAVEDADLTDLDDLLSGSDDPRRLVATALVSDDTDKAGWAAGLVKNPLSIPAPPLPPSPTVSDADVAPISGLAGPTGGNELCAETTSVSELGAGSVVFGTETVARHGSIGGEPELATAAPYAESGPDPCTADDVADAEQYRRTIARLEAELTQLRAELPSKRERRRQRLNEAEVARIRSQLTDTQNRFSEIEAERTDLLERVAFAEQAAADAENARDQADHHRRSMANRLGDVVGRADYLRRLLPNEIAEAEQRTRNLAYGRERSKGERQLQQLRQLAEALDAAFPPVEVVEPEQLQERRTAVQVGASMGLEVLPIGGAEEIGGSALLVRAGGKRILIDAGLRMDGQGPPRVDEVLAGGLDLAVVTHAHTDHAGYLPKLVDRFPTLKIVASQATGSLLHTMWADSAKVMRHHWEDQSAYGVAQPPLYGEAEVESAEAAIVPLGFDRVMRIGDGIELTLFRAGHILGASGVVIRAGDRKVVISGDITSPGQRQLSVADTRIPYGLVNGADLLVIESTYCHDVHRSRDEEIAAFVSSIRDIVDAGGRVLVPAFGLGRSQEVAMIIAEHLPEVDVVIDGLAKQISQIYEEASASYEHRELKVFTGRIRPVEHTLREVRTFQRGVIVTTSGMLTGGPALTWARSILADPHAALFLCGYQDEESPGRRLLDLADNKSGRRFELPDANGRLEDVAVQACVRRYSLSAHADRAGLTEIIDIVGPKATMLVHGVRGHQTRFRHGLNVHGQVTVPTRDWAADD